MLDMPFNEVVYGEMAAFFSEKDAGDILLFGMPSAWEERFRQDFPGDVFRTASLQTEVPETWHGSFSLIVAALRKWLPWRACSNICMCFSRPAAL